MRHPIVAAVRWLYQTKQPDGAAVTHHGVRFKDPVVLHGVVCRVGVIPAGAGGYPVMTFSPMTDSTDLSREEGEAAVRTAVQVAGCPDALPISAWRSTRGVSVSLSRFAGDSLLNAVATYRAGCPHEGDDHDTGSVFCSCGWYSEAHAKLVWPEGW
jgi:hypothetical protein